MSLAGPMLAAMMTPAMMYAGLGAAGLPILIHLLSKRRFRIVRWAAIDFLREAQQRNRRRVQIEELILLALRCLAMFLIGLMLARWFIRPEALSAVLGGGSGIERFVVIDDSFSMELETADGMVFHQARDAARQLVQWVREESPTDALTVLLTSRPDHPLLTESSVRGMDMNAFASTLDELRPSRHAGRMAGTFESIRRMLDSRGDAVNVTVHLFSDFQRYEWLEGGAVTGADSTDAVTGATSPVTPLVDWPGDDRALRLVMIDVGSERRNNSAITSIEPEQPLAVRGVPANYRVKVTNFGAADASPSSMKVFVGDAALPAVAVPAIPARQSAEVPLEITFPREGPERITVELEGDVLPTDDRRFRAEPVARAMRILIVNGEADSDPYEDEVYLLSIALRPEGRQFSGNEVTVVDENEFEATELSPFHVVVLANVYRVNEEWATRLEEYVNGGGGVAIFLGDQVDAELYNRTLYKDGKGLLPARLLDVADAPSDVAGVKLQDVDTNHPMLRRFRDGASTYLDIALFWRWFTADVADDQNEEALQTDLALAASTQPATAEHSPAGVLMRLSAPDAPPIMIERGWGDGKVLLTTTTTDKEWNDLPNHPIYVVLLMEMMQYLARSSGDEQILTVGQPIEIDLDPARYQPSGVVRTPAYPSEAEVRLEAQPDPDTGIPVLRWNESNANGIYRFALVESSGQPADRFVAVNVDSRESDLSRASRMELNAAASGLPFEYLTGEDVIGSGEIDARQELWQLVLLALVLTLVIEQTLAWWFGANRQWNVLWQGRPA